MSAEILLYRPDIHGLHAVLRATARTSLVSFLMEFTAMRSMGRSKRGPDFHIRHIDIVHRPIGPVNGEPPAQIAADAIAFSV
jgi:hypothetical protein